MKHHILTLTLTSVNNMPSPIRDIISINSGGPYGSHMLAGVQKDSNKVWQEVRDSPAYSHWVKARLNVHASETDEWHVTAVDKSGLTRGGPFFFTRNH